MGIKEFASTLIGLSLFKAKMKIKEKGYRVSKISFTESSTNRLLVLDINAINEEDKSIALSVSGTNPIAFLPSMYQNNDFLKRFLWISQHLHYDTISILDNLHYYFTPLEAPDEFVNWMGSWFNVSDKLNLSSEKMRIFLQNALRLYRWRGTKIGLENLVKIVTGVEIQVFENSFPLDEYMVDESMSVVGVITESFEKEQNFFTVFIDQYTDQISRDNKNAIFELIKQEKPVNSYFYVTYKSRKLEKTDGIVIGQETTVQEDGIQS
ncbi:MAG: hypothetical protein JXR70_00225 [Spirochaetales bacterium]|nr:hypothetical protein [Spirochaetales bacterium]